MGKVCPEVFGYLNRIFDLAKATETERQSLLAMTTPGTAFDEFITKGLQTAGAEEGAVERGARAAGLWPAPQATEIVLSSYLGATFRIPVRFVAGEPEGRPETQIVINEQAISITCSGST